MASVRRRRVVLAIAALSALFAFRLLFGLSRELFFEDETQIFLMGLRYHATGAWPYFGPDVVWTQSEIPGALLPLLVGVPLNIVPVPEAPYVLLNMLSFAALAAFAWYITQRVPQVPRWLVWGWLLTVPWTLEFSTHLINPSYLLVASVAFFIGFFEAIPAFRLDKIPTSLAFAMMGAAIGWSCQFHMSWPLLLPYVVLAWVAGRRAGPAAMLLRALAFVCGVLTTAAFVLPTFVVYGAHAGAGGTFGNLRPHPVNPWVLVTTLARFFSFPSLEVWRFIAIDNGKRLMLLLRHPWIAPLTAVVWFAGVWQPIWMLREWFRTAPPIPAWGALRALVAATVGLVYISYWFVMEPPQAHGFYILAPIAFLFAACCWTFVDSPRWRRAAGALLAINIAFHAGLAWIQAPQHSLYQNRDLVAAAVRLKQPAVFAFRRAFAVDGGPSALDAEARPYDGRRDVRLADVYLTMGPMRTALWTVTLQNTSDCVAYRDVLYETSYRDAQGREIDHRSDYVREVFQPHASATIEINDGIVKVPFASATLDVVGASALLPVR